MTGQRPAMSLMLLTLHKAGSSYVGEILKELFSRHGYAVRDLAAAAFDAGLDISRFVADHVEDLSATGTFFGPFRGQGNGLPCHVSPAHPIVHIRDPRDCLVSAYYSLRFSHVLTSGAEGDALLLVRQTLQDIPIDGFVLNVVRGEQLTPTASIDLNFSMNLKLLRDFMTTRTDAVLSRYELMVMEFPDWLVGLVEQLAFDVDWEIVIDIIERTNFLENLRVVEDQLSHKRQILPGDFRRKLTPRTQDLLTAHYEEELRFFGYL
jgi:hypothetical protein